MSKTYRVNPQSFEETQERNFLKRKKKESHDKRRIEEQFPDYCETNEEHDERND